MSGAGGLRIIAATVLLAGPCLAGDPAGAPIAEATGRRVYAERCAPCHGDDGAGDGPAAAALEPRPRNLRAAAFWQGRTAEQLRLVVRQGMPGTLMAPFEGVLSHDEIDAVVGYIQRFRPAAGGARAGDGQVSVARHGEDAAGVADRAGRGLPALRGLHP